MLVCKTSFSLGVSVGVSRNISDILGGLRALWMPIVAVYLVVDSQNKAPVGGTHLHACCTGCRFYARQFAPST